MYAFREFRISDHMLDSLRRYIEKRSPVGGFLTAVIQNDLRMAVTRADDNNLRNLPAFISYLYNEAPSQCWGSKEKVEKWVEEGRVAAQAEEDEETQ